MRWDGGQGGDGAQYRGPLAGVRAGAMAVLVAVPLLLWMVWHAVAEAAGIAGVVMIGGLAALWCAGVLYGIGCLVLRFRMHLHQPETLTRRTIRAEVINPEPPALSSQPVAELGSQGIHLHLNGPLTREQLDQVDAIQQASYQTFDTYRKD